MNTNSQTIGGPQMKDQRRNRCGRIGRVSRYFVVTVCGVALFLTLPQGHATEQPGQFTLQATDWLNRGVSYSGCTTDPARHLAFVAMGRTEDADLLVVDYSDPENPVHVGTVKGFGGCPIPVRGHFLSTKQKGGPVFRDLSDPLNPRVVAALDDDRSHGSVLCSGDLVATAASSTVTTYSVADFPQVNRLDSITASVSRIGSLVSAGSHIFGVDQHTGTYELTAIDASDPASLREVATLSFDSPAVAGYSVGTSAFAARSDRFLLVSNRGEDTIHVIDIGNPSAPSEVARYTEEGISLAAIAAINDSNFLAVSEYPAGIRTFELAEDGSIHPLSDLVPHTRPTKVTVEGDLALVTSWDTDLTIVDIGTPETPRVIGESDPHPEIEEFAADGGYVYTIMRGLEHRWTLQARRVDPRTGRMDEPVDLCENAFRVAAADGIVVAVSWEGWQVFRRTGDGQHQLIWRLEDPPSGRKPDVNGRLVCFGPRSTAGEANFYRIEEETDQLTLIGTIDCGIEPKIFGTHAVYEDEESGGLAIIDIMADGGPALQETIPMTDLGEFQARGNTLFAADPPILYEIREAPDRQLTTIAHTNVDPLRAELSPGRDTLVVWSGSTADIYGYGGALGLHKIGTSRITPHY